jgi:hypothetical protein
MIQLLSDRYRRLVAFTLYLSFYIQVLGSLAALAGERSTDPWDIYHGDRRVNGRRSAGSGGKSTATPVRTPHVAPVCNGGPNTPEAGSFKSVNTDNLVNLFTGDFSYSIPLLDVGGYPVNIFYNGGITMEQEASWVGLGWNINPGSVSRTMRGIPDDFDGSDTLVQVTNVKPNKTWGGSIGLDAEIF